MLGSEIYRTDLDTSNSQGLAKVGDPLPFNTSAEASDHWAVFADFELEDAIPVPTSYSLTDAAPKVVENFDAFAGTDAPAPLMSSSTNWQGLYDGSNTPANFSFDVAGDRSPGVVAGPIPVTFSATFDNDTTTTIEGLEFSYLARQFTANNPGTTDTLTASLVVDDGPPLALSQLDFTASPTATLPRSESLATTIDGLAIPSGSSFTLTLTATQGPADNGPVTSAIFINELHYDNDGIDTGEFIEVIVGPGFTGNLNNVSVALYNQSGNVYDTLELSSFTNFEDPTVTNGYRVFFINLPSNGLQNGPNDGLALVLDDSVVSFLSYEGTLTAASGPAAGQVSQDIGSQSNSGPIGVAALGLTGTGVDDSDLSYINFGNSVPHSPGQLNEGETLTRSAPLPGQAFSFDNLTVCIAGPSDNDNDGNPDSSDPDDDNDQLPDLLEAMLGTDSFPRRQ